MRAVTIKDAKAHLNELIEAAERGEQVVLMRGSAHVATIVPISDADLELSHRLTDAQAAKVWTELRRAREEGETRSFDDASGAVAFLRGRAGAPRRARRR
jgi:prevent-host-death family protein